MVTLTGDSVMISATADGNSNIPDGYSSIFVLTSGEDLVIEKVNGTPEFTVTEAGLYTIHTLVYDGREDSANYLNLGVVQFGTTTGGDVLGLVGANGLCAALDVTGAPITVEDCTADAGTLQATSSMVTLTGDSVMISATADGNSNIPHGYSSIFVLTSGEDLVIEKVNGTPEFTVTEAGLYTIHTLVYDGREDSANYLNLGVVQFGTTTGGDVLGLVGANGLCAALDVTGAPITVEEDTAKCNAFSGTMYSKNPISCLSNGRAIISAKTNRTPVIPNGYKQLYVLTEAYSLTILKVSEAPKFEVNHAGFYRIHSLVYNPQTLDLSVVVPGQTTGFDVVNLIKSNNICASLDAKGAINLVIGSKWFCYFFNKYFNRGNSSASARGGNDFDMDRFVDNYDSYEAFKKDFIATNSKSKFFPNPVVNTLKVELELFENEVMNYSIIDIRGRNIVSGIARNLEFGLQNIDTRRLTSGMYLVQFVSEYRTITKKIIVKK